MARTAAPGMTLDWIELVRWLGSSKRVECGMLRADTGGTFYYHIAIFGFRKLLITSLLYAYVYVYIYI